MPEPTQGGVAAQVLQALEESQRSFAGHRKCIIRLKQAQAADAAVFRDTLNASIDRALVIFRREPCIERMLQLVSSLVCFSNDKYHADSELAVHLLQRMVPLTTARDKAVRFRACQLTAKLLNSLGEDAEVSEELYEEILQAMLARLNDKVPVVRVHAVAAVARLQDPTDSADPVTAEYMRLISSDTSKEVRKAVLANLGVSALTLPHILERLRDVKDDVRKYTYSVVAIKIDVKALKIEQRVLLIGGLQDRCEAVRKACVHMMVSKWLPRCDNNPINLLKLLDVELHPEQAERAVRAILGEGGIKSSASAAFLPYHENRKKFGDALTAEEAFYWRVLGKVATERNDDELMEAALPEIPAMSQAITANLGNGTVTGELMQLVPLLDFGDEVGRKRLYTMLGSLLLNYHSTLPSLVPHLLAALSAMESSAEFVAFVGGVMRQVEASGEEKEAAEGVPADGAPCWRLHVLALCKGLLRMVSRFSEIALLSDYIKRTTEQLVQDPREDIRHGSIECLGLFALLDELVAGSYMPLFVKVLKYDSPALQVTALSAIMDALLIFRQSSWNAVPKQLNTAYAVPGAGGGAADKEGEDKADATPEDTSSIWNLVFSCLHHPSSGVRGTAAEGLGKLVLAGRIVSSKVEHQLLLALALLYFSPMSESDVQLRQCLAVFFPAFANKEQSNALALAHLVFPALKHVGAAPKTSPLSKVNALQLGQYLLSVMDEAVDGTQGAAAVHLSVATQLCKCIADNPSHGSVKVWAKLLNQMRVDNSVDLEPLAVLVKQAQASVTESTAATAISKFDKSLEEVMNDEAPPDAVSRNKGEEDEDHDDVADALASGDDKMQTLDVKEDEGEEDVEVKAKADQGGKPKQRPTPLLPTLIHQVKERAMGEDVNLVDLMDVNLGGLFGHDDAPCSKADQKQARKRGAAARRALQDDDEDAPTGVLSPHSPLRVRRSTRATKPAVSAVKKEVDLDKLLQEQEEKEKAAWLRQQDDEDEDEDEAE